MKTCKACKKRLSPGDFYKDARGKDGLYSVCKRCHNKKSDTRKMERYRSDEKYREKVKEKNRKYVRSEKFKEYCRKKYATDVRYRKRVKCKGAVRRALKRGELVKKKCFCGKEAEAHHLDYNYPLEIMWLCREHHAKWHSSNAPRY